MIAARNLAGCLALLAGVLIPVLAPAQHQHGVPMVRASLAKALPETALVDQEGRRFTFAQSRGKPLLIAFIYTSCHHICPLIYDSATAVQARARAAGQLDLVLAFVTVDPEIDTPEILKAYAARRGADLATSVFLTGSRADLQSVWDAFGLTIRHLGRGLVDHPPLTFLADSQGTVRFRYTGTMLDGETVLGDLRRLTPAAAKN